MTRRTFLIGLALAASATPWRAGIAGPPSTGRAEPGQAARARTLIGYGLVNGWPHVDPARLADSLASAGLTLTQIEYVPWFDASAAGGESTRTDVLAAARFVVAMRTRRITTFVNVVNWNGRGQRAESDQWFRDRVVEIRERIGPDDVLLQGVSEPDTNLPNDKARQWQQIAREEWPGTFVVYGQRARVPGPFFPSAYDYLDVHHCAYEQMLDLMQTYGPRVIASTDCTPLIARHLGAARAARLVHQAIDHGTNLLVYDHDRMDVDERILAAMGEAVRLGNQGGGEA